MDKYAIPKEQVELGNYIQAYDEYTKMIANNPEDYTALYNRALIDCYFLRSHFENSKNDLLLVFAKHKKLAKKIPMYLCIICDTLKDYNNAIYYGELAFRKGYIITEENLLEIHFALSRSYYLRGESLEDYANALREIDECSKISDDVSEELLLCKCDILIVLERFDEVLEIINKMFFNSSVTPVLYYFKGRALFGASKGDLTQISDALDNFNTYKNYEQNDYLTSIYQASCLKILGKPEEAVKIFRSLQNDENEEEIISEIIKTYEQSGLLEEAIKIASEYLKKHDSWQVKYALGMAVLKRTTNYLELEQVQKSFEQCYEESKNEIVAESLIQLYRRMGLDSQNFEFLKKIVETSEDGRFDYYLAIEYFRYLGDYEKTCKYLKISFDKGYFTEEEYLDMLMSFVKEPSKYYHLIYQNCQLIEKDVLGKKFENFSIGCAHKLACRYLYGMHGYRQNLDKALKFAKTCYDYLGDDCCMAILYGRSLEFAKRYEESWKVINKSYDATQKAFRPLCYCSYAYLANLYYQGLGVEKDEEKAKQLILEAVKNQKEKSDCAVLSLYAYFALSQDNRFSKNQAIIYLTKNNSFARYDLSRYQLLILLDSQNKKQWQKLLKESFKNESIMARKHYQSHKNDSLFYPFLNNY